MKKTSIVVGIAVAASTAVMLTGCRANLIGGSAAGSGVSPSATTSAASSTPSASASSASSSPASTPPRTSAPSGARASGRPPQPAAPTTSSDAVPGLTAAIAKASHPGLGVCGSDYSSLVAASGDLRGIGSTQYLVDTTCQGATGSSPDEVAIYQSVAGALTRTAVLSQPAAGAPVVTSYPYLDGPHTVVLTYESGAEYRLVGVGASSITVGPLQKS